MCVGKRSLPLLLADFGFFIQVLQIQGLPRELFGQALYNLQEVCGHRVTFPGSLVVSGEISKFTANPHAVGERAEVWRGELSPKGGNTRIKVCLKTMKIGNVRPVGDRSLPAEVNSWLTPSEIIWGGCIMDEIESSKYPGVFWYRTQPLPDRDRVGTERRRGKISTGAL